MTESYYPKFANSGPVPEVTPPNNQARGPNGARWLYVATTVGLAGLFGEWRNVGIAPGWIAGAFLKAVEEQDPDALVPP